MLHQIMNSHPNISYGPLHDIQSSTHRSTEACPNAGDASDPSLVTGFAQGRTPDVTMREK